MLVNHGTVNSMCHFFGMLALYTFTQYHNVSFFLFLKELDIAYPFLCELDQYLCKKKIM